MIEGTIDNFTMQAYTFRFSQNGFVPYTLTVKNGRVISAGQEYDTYSGTFQMTMRDRGRFVSLSCQPYPETEKLSFDLETEDARGRTGHVFGWIDYLTDEE